MLITSPLPRSHWYSSSFPRYPVRINFLCNFSLYFDSQLFNFNPFPLISNNTSFLTLISLCRFVFSFRRRFVSLANCFYTREECLCKLSKKEDVHKLRFCRRQDEGEISVYTKISFATWFSICEWFYARASSTSQRIARLQHHSISCFAECNKLLFKKRSKCRNFGTI